MSLLSFLGLADEEPKLIPYKNKDVVIDTTIGITWQKNANLAATETFGVSGISSEGTMTWDTAKKWIAAMNAANYLDRNDWRLPTFIDYFTWEKVGKNFGYKKEWGYSCNDTELGWMFYMTAQARPGKPILSSYGAKKYLTLFNNIQEAVYWLGDDGTHQRSTFSQYGQAYRFDNNGGFLSQSEKNSRYDLYHVWAVRDLWIGNDY